MVKWGKTERRWRRAAAEAIAPGSIAAERDATAAEVARRIWVVNGGAQWAMAENEGSLVALETLVIRYISDRVLRAALGLKYLQRLEEAQRWADYEDVAALAAEIRWVGKFFDLTIFGAEGASSESAPLEEPEPSKRRLDDLYQELASLVQVELKAAEIAA